MKISIVGLTGKMGQEVAKLLNPNEMIGGIASNTSDEDFENIIKNSTVVIDFSVPNAAIKAAKFCAKHRIPLICGTTGFSERGMEKLQDYAKHTPILYSSNFSIGIYLLTKLIRMSEAVLDDFDISIIDRHHSAKQDSPSGTTLLLASHLKKKPQIVSLRVGGIAGDHICSFTGRDEEITIMHRSFNRRVFASGSIHCARWILSQKNGFYTLKDCLYAEK